MLCLDGLTYMNLNNCCSRYAGILCLFHTEQFISNPILIRLHISSDNHVI